jgi:hypothetical protein
MQYREMMQAVSYIARLSDRVFSERLTAERIAGRMHDGPPQ